MTYKCPKCGRYGMEWDGRAKAIMCYFSNCNHVIPLKGYKRAVPTKEQIEQAIRENEVSMTRLEASRKALVTLEEALRLSKAHPAKMDKRIYDAMISGIEEQIESVKKDIESEGRSNE